MKPLFFDLLNTHKLGGSINHTMIMKKISFNQVPDILIKEWNFTKVTDNSLICDNGPWYFEIYLNPANQKFEMEVTMVVLPTWHPLGKDWLPTKPYTHLKKSYSTFKSLHDTLCAYSGCDKF